MLTVSASSLVPPPARASAGLPPLLPAPVRSETVCGGCESGDGESAIGINSNGLVDDWSTLCMGRASPEMTDFLGKRRDIGCAEAISAGVAAICFPAKPPRTTAQCC